MHRIKEKRFIESVKSMTEGQLLQLTFNSSLSADSTEVVKAKFPVGRGDAYGFSLNFIGSTNDLITTRFTFSINGKDIIIDEPASAYMLNTGDLVGPLSTGTSRNTKTMILIPEGAILQLTTTTGLITGPQGSAAILDTYLTENFIPFDTQFNLVQYFEHTAIAGSFTKFEAILPAARGRIVGISLFTNNVNTDFNVPDLKATLEINGVSIIEDFNPQKYLNWQQALRINNWVVNIGGGSVLRSTMDNANGRDVLLGYFIYFSEKLESKRARGLYKKTQELTSESVGR